jgi:hypothetical protein
MRTSLQPIRHAYSILPESARAAIRQMIGIHPAGRRFLRKIYEDSIDAYLISFPKCGRTWLRLMIGKAIAAQYGCQDENAILELEPLTAQLSSEGVPIIRVTHDDYPHLKAASELSRNKSKYRRSKVVFLVRDIRDVVVSLYFENLKRSGREAQSSTCKDVDAFVRSEIGSLDSIIAYYNIWAGQIDVPKDFLLVRYEGLHSDTTGELRRVVDFLGLGCISREAVQIAVEYSRFDNMRRMESAGQFAAKKLLPGDKSDSESFKTRRGKVHGFEKYLRPETIAFIDDKVRRELSPYYRDYIEASNHISSTSNGENNFLDVSLASDRSMTGVPVKKIT